jgi:hypothetical protein
MGARIIAVLRLSAPYIVVFAAIEALPVLTPNAQIGLRTVTALLFYFIVHRIALLGTPDLWSGTGDGPVWAFLRFSAVGLLLLCTIFGTTLLLSLPMLAYETEDLGPQGLAAYEITAIIAALFWLVLPLVGTLLPAAAMGRRFSPRAALQAGRATWKTTGLALVLFPGVLWVVLLALGESGAPFLAPNGPALAYAVSFLRATLFAIPPVMTIAILCQAYVAAYPRVAEPA